MTSIVRTYYSYQVPKSLDRTYKLELMGLWGWAELTIGIIVGCLPVLPKFIHHIGAIVSRTFSFASKNGVSAAPGLKNNIQPPKAHAYSKIQRPFAKHIGSSISESSTDTYSPQARQYEDYLASDKYVSRSLSAITTHNPTHPPSVVIATRRDDLEYGEKTF